MTDLDNGHRASRLVGGGVLVLVGFLLALSNAGTIGPVTVGDFWPMVLIWLGATRLLGPGRSEHFVAGMVLLGLGILFQLDRLDWLGFPLRTFWPFVLVGAGAVMVLEGLRGRRSRPTGVEGPGGRP